MVIRTEYRGQRYSMGSLDPLPSRFEIRFGSLNFQATRNGYLMRITNSDELHPWRAPGQGRSPPHPVPTPRRPPKRTPRTPQRHDAEDAPTSALDRRGWNDVGPRVSPHNRRTDRRDDNRTRGGTRGSRAAVPPRHAQCCDGVCLIRQH
jgi:hypothetical protein